MADRLLFVTQVAPYADGLDGELELDLGARGARPPVFGYPLAWCFAEGRGRVFSRCLGHFPGAWESPDYLRHLAGGLEWTLGPA